MDFQEFKDQVILTLHKKKVKATICGNGPVYFFGKLDGSFLAGAFGDIQNFNSIPEDMKKFIYSQGFEFAALCSAAMIGKVGKDSEEIDKINNMSNEEAREYLSSSGLMKKSIAIKVDSKYDEACIINIALNSELEFEEIEEISESEGTMSTADGSDNPFGDGFFS